MKQKLSPRIYSPQDAVGRMVGMLFASLVPDWRSSHSQTLWRSSMLDLYCSDLLCVCVCVWSFDLPPFKYNLKLRGFTFCNVYICWSHIWFIWVAFSSPRDLSTTFSNDVQRGELEPPEYATPLSPPAPTGERTQVFSASLFLQSVRDTDVAATWLQRYVHRCYSDTMAMNLHSDDASVGCE